MGFIVQVLLAVAAIGTSHVLWQLYFSSLSQFPGPFVAKLTNLWRFFGVAGGRFELTQKILHRQYGPAVRLGPNFISLADPSLVKTIYDTKGRFLKVDK